jgi:hypothetical protein
MDRMINLLLLSAHRLVCQRLYPSLTVSVVVVVILVVIVVVRHSRFE